MRGDNSFQNTLLSLKEHRIFQRSPAEEFMRGIRSPQKIPYRSSEFMDRPIRFEKCKWAAEASRGAGERHILLMEMWPSEESSCEYHRPGYKL